MGGKFPQYRLPDPILGYISFVPGTVGANFLPRRLNIRKSSSCLSKEYYLWSWTVLMSFTIVF